MATKQPVKTSKTKQKPDKKKQGIFMKVLIVSIFILIITYTTIVLIFSANSWVVPDSLTIAFFGFMTGELSLLGMVKSCKIKKMENE